VLKAGYDLYYERIVWVNFFDTQGAARGCKHGREIDVTEKKIRLED
jgi:hypothetical protein